MKNLRQLSDLTGQTAEYLKENFSDETEICDHYDLVYDDYNEKYIHQDDSAYCECEGITTHMDNTFYCDYSEEYFSLSYSAIYVEGSSGKYISSYWVEKEYLSRFNLCELHNGEVWERDLCVWVECESAYYHQDDVYYWESDGEYHLEEEQESGYIFSYHDSNPSNFSGGSIAKIGFEIEKEDLDVKKTINANDIQNKFGWGVERDGSLDDTSGFELVSPIFDLYGSDDYFNNHFKNVESLINANFSSNCGGHINYSNLNYKNSLDLFDAIAGYLPLLYAIYPHRIEVSFCEAKSSEALKSDLNKYQSICFKGGGIVEFRIFPAVRNIKNLKWRLKLIQILDSNKTPYFLDVVSSILDINSDLYKHLSLIFNHDKIIDKVRTMLKYIKEMEGISINTSTLKSIDEKINNLNNLTK